jgi:hypothetical protein
MMTSIQLEQAILELRKGSVAGCSKFVEEVIRSRGLDPRKYKSLWRAMVNRAIINYNYKLDEMERQGYR